MRVMTIATDGTITLRDEEALGLRCLQDIVGGYIEPIDISIELGGASHPGATMFVNEEGKFSESRNEGATRLAHHFGAIFSDDWVAGNVALVGLPDQEGCTTELPEVFAQEALRIVTGPATPPVQVAPAFWEAVAEAVYAGVPCIAVAAPEDFRTSEEQA